MTFLLSKIPNDDILSLLQVSFFSRSLSLPLRINLIILVGKGQP